MRAASEDRIECRMMTFLHAPNQESEMSVVGQGTLSGHLPDDAVSRVVDEGLGTLPLDGQRVLVIIPDGTRTMPMPFMFDAIERALRPRVAGARLPRGARDAFADERRGAVGTSAGRW